MPRIVFAALPRPLEALPPERLELRPAAPRPATRCPWCHDDVVVQEFRWVACATCLARHHTGCWSDGQACASCGAPQFVRAPRVGEATLLLRGRAPEPARWPCWPVFLSTLIVAGGLVAAPLVLSQGPNALGLRVVRPEGAVAEEVARALRATSSDLRADAMRRLARTPSLTLAERTDLVDGIEGLAAAQQPALLLEVANAGPLDPTLQHRLVRAALHLETDAAQAEVLVDLVGRAVLSPEASRTLVAGLERIEDPAARQAVLAALLRAQEDEVARHRARDPLTEK